jgi:hypothetical protein
VNQGSTPGFGRALCTKMSKLPNLSLRSAGTFGPVRRLWGIDFVAFFAPKMPFGCQNL